jgi:hypothetical protein
LRRPVEVTTLSDHNQPRDCKAHVIRCTIKQATPATALIAKRVASGVLYLGHPLAGPCPVGLNIDSQVIFDMHVNGRVLGIEFFARIGGSLMSPAAARKVAKNTFHTLILVGVSGSFSAEHLAFNLQHDGSDCIKWAFGHPENPKRYWLGGGGFADIEGDALVGIGIQFHL